jgi:ATP-dependent DNA helicase RecQ
LKIARLAKELKVERVLALTATATPSVARDVRGAFDIAEEDEVHTGFYRPNLKLSVVPCTPSTRDDELLARIRKRPPGPAIVYVTLQRTAEEVANFLSRNGLNARAYHAGLENGGPHGDPGRLHGLERSPSSWPPSPLAWAWTSRISATSTTTTCPRAWRVTARRSAARDVTVKTSVCEMLACPEDVITLDNFTYGDTPERATVAGLARHMLDAGTFDVSEYDLSYDTTRDRWSFARSSPIWSWKASSLPPDPSTRSTSSSPSAPPPRSLRWSAASAPSF